MRSVATTLFVFTFVLALGIGSATRLRAQDAQFTASADRTEIAMGEQFQVTFTLSGGRLKSYSDFRAPDLNRDFLTLAGPSTSQNMQIINGRVSTSISWTYILQARTVGTFTLAPATIKYDGATLRSGTLRLTVKKAAPQAGQQRGGKEQPADVELGDNLFIRAIPSKTAVYIGEPITVTYKLYTRVAFQLDNPIKLPRMVGFWSEDIEAPTQLQPKVEVYNGKQYETFMMRKVLYFPTQSGDLTIEPFEVGTTVRVRKRRKTGDDFFDRFFSDPYFDSYEGVKKTLMTGAVRVKVRPLPEDGKPKSFTGVVGKYEMDVTLDKQRLKTDETATLKVLLRGSGNIRLLDEPAIAFPSGLDHYDPAISENVEHADGTMRGNKSFEYILVPRYPGKITVPPVEFSYFDLEKKRYVTHSSPAMTLVVDEGEKRREAGEVERRMIDYLARDIRAIKDVASGEALETVASPAVPLPLMAAAWALPLLAFGGALLWKKRYDRLHADVTGLKRRRATRVAEKHLSRSRGWLDKGSIDAYYQEIARALWGYVQDALGLPTSQTSMDAVRAALLGRNVPEDVVAQLRDALHAVDYARFSPTRAQDSEMRALYDRSREAIIATEQALKGGAA